VCPSLSDADKVALRALIREELGASAAARHEVEATHEDAGKRDGVVAASAQTLEQAVAALTPDQRVTYDDATSLIRDGVARQTWTDEDRQQLREKILSLPPTVAFDVRGQLIVAVNSGQVLPRVRGPLF
jgi:hypothetical protein